jgi:hypothetical protein
VINPVESLLRPRQRLVDHFFADLLVLRGVGAAADETAEFRNALRPARKNGLGGAGKTDLRLLRGFRARLRANRLCRRSDPANTQICQRTGFGYFHNLFIIAFKGLIGAACARFHLFFGRRVLDPTKTFYFSLERDRPASDMTSEVKEPKTGSAVQIFGGTKLVRMKVLALLFPLIMSGAQGMISLEPNSDRNSSQLVVSGSTPGAHLEFFDRVTPLGAASVDQSGRATLAVSGLAPGRHTILVRERGTGAAVAESFNVTVPDAPAHQFPVTGVALGIQPAAFAAGRLFHSESSDFVTAGEGFISVLSSGIPRIFTGVTQPTALLIADFNGDGWNDIAVASASGQIAILLNNGAGSLSVPRLYNAGLHPSSLTTADFNSDGIPDIVVANEGGNDVTLLAGRSDGSFADAVPFAAGFSPRSVAAADLNGDGFADLAVADFAGNNITILLGDGQGAFRAGVSIPAGNGPSFVVAGDFNEDGVMDLAVLNQLDRTVSILIGAGSANYGQGSVTSAVGGVVSLAAGHILGSGHIDLIVQSGSALQILAGAGDGTFASRVMLATSAAPQSLLLGDFNGDGRIDLAAADMGGVLSVFTGSAVTVGAQALAPVGTTQILAASGSAGITLLHTSLMTGSVSTTVGLSSSSPASNLGQSVTLTAVVSPQAATGKVTFYNGTTIIGVEAISSGQAQFTTPLLPSGTNSLQARYTGDATYVSSISTPVTQGVTVLPMTDTPFATTTLASGANPNTVVAADFNNDGKIDIAVTNNINNGGVSVFLGNGSGGFTAVTGSPFGTGTGTLPYGLVAVDLNGDGNIDLAFTNATSTGGVTVLKGDGTGAFSTLGTYATGGTPESVAAGDFNNDGIADLAVANLSDGTVSILIGNGDGSLTPASSAIAVGGTNPISVTIADFNGDGNADIVTANNGTATLSVLLGDGTGGFTAAIGSPFPSGPQPVSVTAADLNGDGKPDLAVANSLGSAPTVGVFINTGRGAFAGRVGYTTIVGTNGFDPRFIAVGDFNGDGTPDLAVINKGAGINLGTFSILLGSKASPGTFGLPLTTGLGSLPWSAVVADFNGDGRSDLVVASSQNSFLYVLSGHAVYADLTVATIPVATFTQGQTGAAYTITVSNNSSNAQYTTSGLVSVVDSLPAGLTATSISGTNWSCTLATLTCTRSDSLASGSSYPETITVTVNVASNAALTVTNLVTVSGGGEFITTNDTSSYPTTVIQKTSLALSSSPNPSFTGTPVAVTATVSFTSATGTVVFYDALTPIASRTVVSGQAVLNTSLLSSGTHVLTARYSGDSQYLTSSAASITQTVQNQLQNGFQSVVNYGLNVTGPSAITVADFNNDGHPDIAVASSTSGKVSVLLNNATTPGIFGTAVSTAAGTGPASIVAGDFNGDGFMDVAVANTSTSVINVLINNHNGNGTFSPAQSYSTGKTTHPQYLVTGDFNGDGIPDLAVANGTGVVSIMLGNTDGSFQAPLSPANTVGTNPKSIVLGDFNGDGFADLAVANFGSNSVSILLGKGDGTFQPAANYNVGASPLALARGDFNGDGILDLVVANSVDGTVTVLTGGVGGTFTVGGSYPAGSGPNSIVASDFNGDGLLDLAIGNSGGGVSLLLGGGNGTFQSPLSYSAATTPIGLASADFDGDGTSDLAVANQGSNNVSVLLGGLFFSDVTIAKSHTGNFAQGQTGATYTLTVSNVGAYSTAGVVTAKDILPGGLTATAISGSNWSCTLASLSCTRSDALAPNGATYDPITVTVSVAANALLHLTNTATVSGGHENNAANDSATDLTTVVQTTTTGLAVSDPNWVYNESVTLIASVSSSAATGTVTFSQGSTALGTVPVSNGVASIAGPVLAPGSYNFTAIYSGDSSYSGSTGTLTQAIGKATASVLLTNLNVTWNGNPQPVIVTTTPASLTVVVTYSNNSAVPSNVGTYSVAAAINDPDYVGVTSGSLIISPIQATVNLAIPPATWDGTAKAVTATTTPLGLAVSITYGGSSTAPTAAASYAVVATITTPNYAGSSSGTLLISSAAVTINLSGFSATYDGTAKSVGAITSPANIPLNITYNGSSIAPTAAGSYSVSAAPGSSNYSGSASGTLIVNQAPATFTFVSLTGTYTGVAQPVSVIASPSTFTYSVKYNGSISPPITAGSYNVVVTATDPNYTGGNSGTYTVQKATPVVTWANPAALAFGSPLTATQLNATSTPAGSPAYSPVPGTVLLAGANQTLSVTFAPNDPVNYNSVTATTTITINPSGVQGVLITVAKVLSRDANNNIVVNLTLSNGGNTDAGGVTLTNVKIGTFLGSPLPISLGTIHAGQTAQTTVVVPGSAGVSGAVATMAVGGTWANGSFSTSVKLYLP